VYLVFLGLFVRLYAPVRRGLKVRRKPSGFVSISLFELPF
jgi:hypothetical protein